MAKKTNAAFRLTRLSLLRLREIVGARLVTYLKAER